MSCLPHAIDSYDSPIASEPEVHAVPVGSSRPVVPKCTERLTAHVCAIIFMYVELVTLRTSLFISTV